MEATHSSHGRLLRHEARVAAHVHLHLTGSRHDSHGATCVLLRHSWEHEVNIHVKGSAHLLLSLSVFLLLDVLSTLLHDFHSGGEVLNKLDEVRHNKLLEILSPCDFESNIRLDKVVASVKHSSKELFILHGHDVSHEVFTEGRVSALSNSLHSVLVKFVLLGDIDGLLEFLAFTVKERRNSASVKKLMALEVRSKVQRFEAIVLFDGVAEAFKVFIL